jgi:hypothetical protein
MVLQLLLYSCGKHNMHKILRKTNDKTKRKGDFYERGRKTDKKRCGYDNYKEFTWLYQMP